ncbi:MAG: DUF799 family lipoprotein [Planctomycetota bacterium]
MSRRRLSWILVLALPWIAACQTNRTYRDPEFNALANRRVAVLPFVPEYSGRNLPTSIVDEVPLVGRRVATGEDFLRQAFTARLSRGAYDIAESAYVDTRLVHAGLYGDYKYQSASPEELGALLSVDAVVIAKVKEWDITYLALETRHTVGVELQMIDVDTGSVLVSADVEESDGAGLSGGPTGFTDLAVQPILGLSSANLVAVGRRVCDRLVDPFLPSDMDLHDADLRAPFLLFATHDQPAEHLMEAGDVLTIVAQGAPDMRAEWVFTSLGYRGSMSEIEPGSYVGKVVIPPGLILDGEIVSVELFNDAGYLSVQNVAHKPLNTLETRS